MSCLLPSHTLVVYSVAELNQMVGMALIDGFPALKVTGEVSNLSCPKSGHCYFSLKDSSAQIRCVFFQARQYAGTLALKDGMQVVVTAKLRLYEVRGDFQLVIEKIEVVGDGALQKQFETLKTRLSQEGLFDSTRKKKLPSFIRTIGLITSPTGAAIHDVLTILKRRFPRLAVIIYPTLVQGEEAAKQIVMQIQVANTRSECQALLLTRGGGSLEDLWPFNEEIVARAIAGSQLPIVSAIGHEIDITISDFAADVRAPTPSAAAELLSPDQLILRHRLDRLKGNLSYTMSNSLNAYAQRLIGLKRGLRHPEERLKSIWQQLDEYEHRMYQAIQSQRDSKQQRLVHLIHALETLNPLATLVRGYSLTKRNKNDTILQDASKIKVGESITVQLAKGSLLCEVKKCFSSE